MVAWQVAWRPYEWDQAIEAIFERPWKQRAHWRTLGKLDFFSSLMDCDCKKKNIRQERYPTATIATAPLRLRYGGNSTLLPRVRQSTSGDANDYYYRGDE